MATIAVAMSGGVDSSVAAALLQQQGHHLIGLTMQLFAPCSPGPGSAAHDAALVAAQLEIPHHIINLEQQFSSMVVADFIQQYRQGQTPNPCICCNRSIKFGLLLDAARQLGADFLATGHYVRKTVTAAGSHQLRMAANCSKDQSYFLYTLSSQQLQQLLFPLGEISSKDEVRQLASQFNLPVADKGDSQEVCFIPDDDYVAFLEGQGGLQPVPGEIIHISGKPLGQHSGTHRYTIGQRKGLGIAWSEPLYVLEIDPAANRLVVGEQQHLLKSGLMAETVSWINQPPDVELDCSCKIRYRHQPIACRVRSLPDDRCQVEFMEPQRSVTPGQYVVFYQDDQVLGGGRIVSG